MTRKEEHEKMLPIVREFYPTEGPTAVQKRLAQIGIERAMRSVRDFAYRNNITYRGPEQTDAMRQAVREHYAALGQDGVRKILSEKGISVRPQTVRLAASELGIRRNRGAKKAKTTTKAPAPETPYSKPLAEVMKEIKNGNGKDKAAPAPHLIETSVFPVIVEETTLEKPFVVDIPRDQMPILRAINTPMIGVCADTHPYRNPLSNTLRLSEAWRRHEIDLQTQIETLQLGMSEAHISEEKRAAIKNEVMMLKNKKAGFPVLVITGNFIYVDTLKYSKLRAHRSLVEQTKPIQLSELNMEEDREASFISVEDRIKDRVEMLKKATTDEEGRALYNGTILITFGKREEDIITLWVDEHVRKVTAEKQDELRMERSELRQGVRGEAKAVATLQRNQTSLARALLELEQQEPSEAHDERRREILAALEETNRELQEKELLLAEANAKLKEIRDELKETLATNIASADTKRWFFEGQLRLKQMVEEVVPNAKVIATGDCYIRTGDKVVRIVQDNSDSPTDTFLDKLAQKIQKELKNGKKQPDLILIGGLNLAPTDFSIKYPKAEGLHREITEVAVVQLPTCLDNDYIEKITARGVKIGTEITKLVSDEDFTSGVVDYCWPSEFPQLRFWSSTDLVNEELFSRAEEIEKLILGSYQIYGEYESDMQEGAHHQAYYSVAKFPYKVPLYQVHHWFFTDVAAPIHYYANLGDIVQGENHEYHLEIPEDFRITHQLEKEIGGILRDANMPAEEKAAAIAKITISNSILGGTPRIDHQLKNYEMRAIVEGTEYFCMVLRNAKRIRLEFIEKANIITCIGGNHFGNTGKKSPGGVGKHFEEADIVREALIKALRRCAGFSDEDLERLIVAPRISGVSAALGAFGILPEGVNRDDVSKLSKQELKKLFPYCFSAKHKPAGKETFGSRGLPVKSLRRARSTRGPTDPLYEGRFALEVAGHIDRDTSFISRGSLYSVSPAQEFRSPFAESLDFGLGDIGTKVIGVPKDRKGPIVITRFTYEVFFRYLKNPWQINAKLLFPNAL